MKFLMLLNHGTFSFFSKFLLHVDISLSDDIIINTLISFQYAEVRGLVNKKHVQEGHEQVQQALLDYTLTCYPSIPVCLSHI